MQKLSSIARLVLAAACGVGLFWLAEGRTTTSAQGVPQRHPAIGAWFGRAVQACPAGVAPSACYQGRAAGTLYMTPTLHEDGTFLGADTFELLAPPAGPHTAAMGEWSATSPTGFAAEYTFIQNTFPTPKAASMQPVRFRWQGQVIDQNTATGTVNISIVRPLPLRWERLWPGEFPQLPEEMADMLAPPHAFVTDPSTCTTADCPAVYKFTLKRYGKS